MHRLAVAAIGVLIPLALVASAQAQSSAGAATVATLSVLAPPVDHRPAGTKDRQPSDEGMNLAEGDTVFTGPQGVALVTFLDGSTVTVEPGSAVVIRQASVRDGESSMRLLILVGKVWARIAQQVARRTSLSLESNAYTATAHDGLIGAEHSTDGTFVCWTRRGDVTVRDPGGATVEVVTAGRKLTARPGKTRRVEAFQVHESTLEITASPNVLPLVHMPDGQRMAGWALSGVEVNQVFGSLTAADAQTRQIEVPGGRPGPYTVSLVGLAEGPFEVTLVARFQGRVVYRHRATGTIERGEQRQAYVYPHFRDEDGRNPTTSRVMGATIEPLRPSGPRSGTVTVSPAR
jgi:FecR protein